MSPSSRDPDPRPDPGSFRLSVAAPLFEEEAVVDELLERLGAVLDGIEGGPHEIVCVDDGSRDGTGERLEAWTEREHRLVVVRLSRNFGHQAALSAALDHATGDAVVLLDGDLQDPPEAIPRLVARYQEGYDVVYVRRVDRKESWLLRVSYWLFYRLATTVSDIPLPLDAGDFSLMSRKVVEALRRTRERHRYLRGLRSWVGFRQIGVGVERAPRAGGESKYTLRRLVGLAFDGLFSFTVVPLRMASVLGALAILLTGAYGTYALWARLVWNRSPEGFTGLIVTLVLGFGVVLLFLGVIGEYVGRIHREVKARPIYLVDRVVGRAPD